MTIRRSKSSSWLWLALVALVPAIHSVHGASLSAQVAVGATEVFLGEAFQMQIQISGSDQPGQPDLSALNDFTVQTAGGAPNNRSSVTIVNGRMTQEVRKSYLMNYQLTPKRVGRLIIPSISVKVEGATVRTQPLAINVQKPMEIDNFKLTLELSKQKVYAGEPVRLKLVWYVGQNVQNVRFNLPILNDGSIRATDPKHTQQPGIEYLRMALGGDEIIAAKGAGTLGGKNYTTVSFEKILIPQTAGIVRISPATVAFEALIGYRRNRSPGLFSEFFGSQQQGVYKRQVIPSNPMSLEVLALPSEGRPSNFAGHVGDYQIAASAAPTDVNVGDPITLTIALSGPDYLDHVELPPLQQQPKLAAGFKIPSERESGKYDGVRKVFTQTVRARQTDISAIPPIELPYFDTDSETYKVARSEPIPITVHETKIVTASDAEGLSLENPASSAVEAWARGIAYNYEGLDAIVDQRYGPESWLRSPVWLSMIGLPPLAYAILLAGVIVVRRRDSDPWAVRSRKVFGEVSGALASIANGSAGASSDAVLDNLRKYLGDKLRLSHGALTFKDAEQPLAGKGVSSETLDELEQCMKICEANRYSGSGSSNDPRSAANQCLSLIQKLEDALKSPPSGRGGSAKPRQL